MFNIRNYSPINGDWTPALNLAVLDCIANNEREIYFPYIPSDNGGNYSFKTKPDPFGVGITLRGENPRQFLVRDYVPSGSIGTPAAAFLVWDGSGYNGDPNQNKGGGMFNIGIGAGNGTTGGVAMHITGASTTHRPGYMLFQNVVCSIPNGSNGSWWGHIMVKGNSVTTQGSQGMRDLVFRDMYLFRATGDSVQVTNGVHIFFDVLSVINGGVTNPENASVRINGLGSVTSNSTQVLLSNCDIEGTLFLTSCSRVFASGYISKVSTDSSATQCKVSGIINTNNAASGTVVT